MRIGTYPSKGVSRCGGMSFGRAFHLAAAISIAIGSASAFNGCSKLRPAPPAAAAAPPPPAVTVAKPLQQDVIEWDTYNGYLEAKESVNVSARVSGLIMSAPFEEGSVVRKSQVLFEIDERPFKADLDSKLADVERSKAEVAIAQINYRRTDDVLKRGASSQQDFDSAKADLNKAMATLAGSNAAVETSRLNLEWCKVTSPVDGRVSRKIVTAGNLVIGGAGPATPTLLTTIQSVSPIYCNIDVDEQSIQKYQRLATEKKRVHEREGNVPCFVRLGSEKGYPHSGHIDFVDNHLDASTGTLRMRGLLPNASGTLIPGFYASLRIPGSGRYKATLVPDSAIGSDQSHRTVLVVNKENVVEMRIVETGALFGDLRAITSGLSPDERVVVNGQMKAFPGAPVAPTETTLKFDPSSIADSGATPRREPASTAAAAPAPGKTP